MICPDEAYLLATKSYIITTHVIYLEFHGCLQGTPSNLIYMEQLLRGQN